MRSELILIVFAAIVFSGCRSRAEREQTLSGHSTVAAEITPSE